MTKQEEQLLAKPRANKQCRYKGVTCIGGRYFYAVATKDGKRHHLGCFRTEEQAALAYNAGIERLFPGVPKYLNVVKPKQGTMALPQPGL
jgi:hypothetical protein